MAKSELSPAHTGSGYAMTVLGKVAVAELGVTLMHEHILNDCSCWWNAPKEPERQYLADAPISMDILGELRQDPFVNRPNIKLDSEDDAVAELDKFVKAGGQTIVEPTCWGIGRQPTALKRIAQKTKLNIVMGAGHYLHSSHPPEVATESAEDIADMIVKEAVDGIDDTGIRIGLIGEIGVSSDFTPDEEKSLRGAAQAQVRTGLPLMVHLPGWFRLAHRVLDVVAEEGGTLKHTVLCHMNPSHDDFVYQSELAGRGAFIEYDMIGMDYYYADQDVQCPGDEEAANAIVRLVDAGYLDRILVSHDTFLKMMLTRYGGNGYAFVLKHFLPRLRRHGLDEAATDRLIRLNPQSVFYAKAG